MTSVIAIVLVLGLLIFFHELGHFLVAKAFGIGVKTFSLGFGHKLFGFSRGQTQYQVSVVPLGGYVQLVGESPDAELPEGFNEKQSFSLRPPWQRMLVVAAGPVFNFVLAWFIYFAIFFAVGQQAMLPVVGEIQKDSPAQEAGLQEGDRILRVNNQEIDYWSQMAGFIQKGEGQELQLEVERQEKTLDIALQPEMQSTQNIFGEEVQVPRIGVVASGDTVRISLGPLESAWAGLTQTGQLIKLTVQGIGKLIARVVPLEQLGGPILIAQLVSEQAEQGFVDVLALTALISINLGLINLLPIPVLDGGHLIFYGLEIILGRPIDPKWREIAVKVGLVLILGIMFLAIYNDIFRLVQ
ncbi:MAG: RIP metalloprotease RseP [Thermodesulfobacteriota bacterium]